MTDREPPRLRAAYAAFEGLQTRWTDNDQYGHIYNATYYTLFDEAMTRALAAIGLPDPAPGKPILVVVENGCTFFRELSYPDALTVGLSVTRLGRASIRVEMGMFRDEDQDEAARAHFTLVTVDATTRRPLPTPPDDRARLAALMPAGARPAQVGAIAG